MTKPTFECVGTTTVQPEHPSDWSVESIIGKAQSRTLDGTEVKDLTWRKYEYVLTWDAMSLTDFEALAALIEFHNDNGLSILFTYDKFASSISGVEVFADPLTRKRKGGSGASQYYQNVELRLTEVNSRMA